MQRQTPFNRRIRCFVWLLPDIITDRAGLLIPAGPVGSIGLMDKAAAPSLCPIPGFVRLAIWNATLLSLAPVPDEIAPAAQTIFR